MKQSSATANKSKATAPDGRARLARECAKLDPELENRLAEEGMGAELELWPEY